MNSRFTGIHRTRRSTNCANKLVVQFLMYRFNIYVNYVNQMFTNIQPKQSSVPWTDSSAYYMCVRRTAIAIGVYVYMYAYIFLLNYKPKYKHRRKRQHKMKNTITTNITKISVIYLSSKRSSVHFDNKERNKTATSYTWVK